MRRIASAVLAALMLGGCGVTESTTFSSIGETMSACERAFADAASVDELHDSVEDMFPAVRACGSLNEWEATWADYGDDLGFSGTARSVLSNMCLADEIRDTALCMEISE
jgi:hypothetical protein